MPMDWNVSPSNILSIFTNMFFLCISRFMWIINILKRFIWQIWLQHTKFLIEFIKFLIKLTMLQSYLILNLQIFLSKKNIQKYKMYYSILVIQHFWPNYYQNIMHSSAKITNMLLLSAAMQNGNLFAVLCCIVYWKWIRLQFDQSTLVSANIWCIWFVLIKFHKKYRKKNSQVNQKWSTVIYDRSFSSASIRKMFSRWKKDIKTNWIDVMWDKCVSHSFSWINTIVCVQSDPEMQVSPLDTTTLWNIQVLEYWKYSTIIGSNQNRICWRNPNLNTNRYRRWERDQKAAGIKHQTQSKFEIFFKKSEVSAKTKSNRGGLGNKKIVFKVRGFPH